MCGPVLGGGCRAARGARLQPAAPWPGAAPRGLRPEGPALQSDAQTALLLSGRGASVTGLIRLRSQFLSPSPRSQCKGAVGTAAVLIPGSVV